ncbi:MAG: hypothetical protein RIS52_2293 [Pseudomonadota bacterium]|jgi:hypothetical protein
MALVELVRLSSRSEAEIARGRLEVDGITAFCFDTGMNTAESAAIAIPIRLMVDQDDLAEARLLFTELGVL